MENKINERGQTLVFVLITMVIALAIGVSVSTRTISTIKRTTNIDTSARALAAAEAGAEYYLSLPMGGSGGLENLIGNPGSCTAVYGPVKYPQPPASLSSDGIQTTAEVTVKRSGCVANAQPSEIMEIKQDEVTELKLPGSAGGRQLKICWDLGSPASSLYIIEIEGNGPTYNLKKWGYNYSLRLNGFFNANIGTKCTANLKLGANPRVLRILSLYLPSRIRVTPLGFDLPYQGYEIESTGKIGGNTSDPERTVIVTRSLPYLPAPFNFAVFSASPSSDL